MTFIQHLTKYLLLTQIAFFAIPATIFIAYCTLLSILIAFPVSVQTLFVGELKESFGYFALLLMSIFGSLAMYHLWRLIITTMRGQIFNYSTFFIISITGGCVGAILGIYEYKFAGLILCGLPIILGIQFLLIQYKGWQKHLTSAGKFSQ